MSRSFSARLQFCPERENMTTAFPVLSDFVSGLAKALIVINRSLAEMPVVQAMTQQINRNRKWRLKAAVFFPNHQFKDPVHHIDLPPMGHR